MKRKLIQQGLGGFTIYLPKKWIDSKGLKKGSELELREVSEDLIISSDRIAKKIAKKDISGNSQIEIKNTLTHLYRNGYDLIELIISSDKEYVLIKKIVSDILMGFEITEKKSESLILENLSEPASEKYDSLLRRIFLINKEMYSLIIRNFSSGVCEDILEMQDLKINLDKLILFCKRVLNKSRLERDPIIDWELLTFLMHIAHSSYYLFEHAHNKKVIISEDLVFIANICSEQYDLFYDAFYKKDISKIDEINKNKSKYQIELIEDLLRKEKDKLLVSFFRENLRLIQIGTSPILSHLLDKMETDIL